MKRGLRIYIAGPYSTGDIVLNIRAAILAADAVWRKGHIPYVPHLTGLWHMIVPHSYEEWLDLDTQWLLVCDAIVRIPGVSSGADKEFAVAAERGLFRFRSLDDIPWVDR